MPDSDTGRAERRFAYCSTNATNAAEIWAVLGTCLAVAVSLGLGTFAYVSAKKLERRVNDLMRQAVYLNQEIQTNHDLPQEIIEHARASAASLKAIYSHLTGLPPPWDIRTAEMGWNKI